MAVEYLGTGNDDGTSLGRSTDLITFYGGTPIARPSGAGQADIASTAAVSISATQWGYSTSAQATGIVTLVRALRDVVVNTNLAAGA